MFERVSLSHAGLRVCTFSKAHYSHDNLFHSMLGLFAVKTEIYRPELDMFAAVRGQ